MKKFLCMCIAATMLLASGCYKDDINDLNEKYNELSKEQQRQAEVLQNYKALLDALNNQLSVTSLNETSDGYKITFSDGSIMTVKHGEDGQTGTSAPSITNVEEVDGQVLFTMSDGTTIKLRKKSLIGLYILSEGTARMNQAELAYYDVSTSTMNKKYFKAKNGIALGDTGNDLALYGSNLYCVITGASVASGGGYIEIINPSTGMSKKRIPVKDANGDPDMPRFITFYQNKAYVTLYSGAVARIDTASLVVEQLAALSGTYPEGICVYNQNLYICNSGQGDGTTISVVNIAQFEETKTITVPQNPTMIAATSTGDIYFTTADLSWVPSSRAPSNLHLLDARTETVTRTFDCRASSLAIGDNYVYAVDFSWSTYDDYTSKINLKTHEVSNFTNALPDFFMVYSVGVNPVNGDVYITGQGDNAAILDTNGNLKLSLNTGTGYTKKVVPIFK